MLSKRLNAIECGPPYRMPALRPASTILCLFICKRRMRISITNPAISLSLRVYVGDACLSRSTRSCRKQRFPELLQSFWKTNRQRLTLGPDRNRETNLPRGPSSYLSRRVLLLAAARRYASSNCQRKTPAAKTTQRTNLTRKPGSVFPRLAAADHARTMRDIRIGQESCGRFCQTSETDGSSDKCARSTSSRHSPPEFKKKHMQIHRAECIPRCVRSRHGCLKENCDAELRHSQINSTTAQCERSCETTVQ